MATMLSEDNFVTLAKACMMSYDINFSYEAEQAINNIVHEGFRIMETNNELNLPERMIEAQRNIVSFIYELVAESKSNGLSDIESKTFRDVQIKFCPVYPFDGLIGGPTNNLLEPVVPKLDSPSTNPKFPLLFK